MPDLTGRPRPRLHFTPRRGWINDPHGVLWADHRYHLFFQHNPAGTSWRAAVSWGHATSADLVTWQEQAVALRPAPGEVGCWSGSVVLSDRGVPTLFYTRIAGTGTALGQVARAVGDPALTGWRRDPVPAVVTAPPDGVVEFRDPFVWRAADGWRMLVGARLHGDTGAALQYRSADLSAWAYDGIVAQRPSTETAGAWTGSMWECPQLFPLDGTWVLLVSALHDGQPNAVAYALGDYDGRRFTARVWGRFGHGRMYATTAFTDRAGRRCVMSWLPEAGPPPPGSPWAGALSIPWVLRVSGDLLLAEPHPNLAGYPGDAGPHPEESAAVRTLIVDAGIVEMTLTGRSGITTTRRAV